MCNISPFARGKKVGVLPPSALSGSTLRARLSRMATKGLVLDSRSGERYLATKIKSNKEKITHLNSSHKCTSKNIFDIYTS